MPRRARMYVAGLPYHIVQRGNNRASCFLDNEDRQVYLEYLAANVRRYEAELHAYVLMTNHIHLLITPNVETAISSVMKGVGSRFAQFFNKKHSRTGTLWEGRHKSSPVQQDTYLLNCYRYIEMNPIRALIVKRPENYRWSSYSSNALGQTDEAITPHPVYLAMGGTESARRSAYRKLCCDAIPDETVSLIRTSTHYCLPAGDRMFAQEIEQRLGRKLGYARLGRPPSKTGF